MGLFFFRTAIFIDADFCFRRLRHHFGDLTAKDAVGLVVEMCDRHLASLDRSESNLYRILVCDCPPLTAKHHWPVSRTPYDLGKTPMYRWRTEAHTLLRSQRKVVLRLGHASSLNRWVLRPDKLKALIGGRIQVHDLVDGDFSLDITQKGVDMRIGLDIASISAKKLADQLILVSADSDFVPAAKTARRDGIDFILDPMGAAVAPDLAEHVDGIQSVTHLLQRVPPANRYPYL